MKSRFCVLMVLLSVLMLTSAAFSATWTNNNSNNTFSFTGTTVATSTQHGGHGTTYYRVSGSAWSQRDRVRESSVGELCVWFTLVLRLPNAVNIVSFAASELFLDEERQCLHGDEFLCVPVAYACLPRSATATDRDVCQRTHL